MPTVKPGRVQLRVHPHYHLRTNTSLRTFNFKQT